VSLLYWHPSTAQLENILFTNDGDMKLVDFGFSVMCRDPSKKLKIFCGTPSYMAPEIVMRK
jgi:serine/threonine protein kinase